MSRTPAMVLSCVFSIQPGGWALPADADSMWANMLGPMAAAWHAIEVSMESMLPQVDPRNAVQLLPDWQRMLGPDPCGRDVNGPGQAQRLIAYQRLTARGGGSIPYFIGLALACGETATVQEANWSRFKSMRFGSMRFTRPGREFMWQVTLPSVVVSKFRFGTSQFGNRFGSFASPLSQCPITHAAPAHTTVTFNLTGTGTD